MRRILFVDDDPKFLEGLRRVLRPERDKWDIALAPGGEAALALLEASPFDVVISGLRMPEMDGPTLLARVREEYPQIVRIALSGDAEISTALRVVPVAHQVLAKPCDAEMLRVAVERACHLKSVLSDESIRRTVGSLGELPSLPRTFQALTLALQNSEVSTHEIARIIELDVGISAKILQLANSAFFGIARSITSVHDAVRYVGVDTVKSLVLSVETFRAFVPARPIEGFSLEDLQNHARLTAYIATRLPVPKHLANVSMAAGMLHDVGKLIVAWKLPERMKGHFEEAWSESCPLYKIEERESGFSHAEIGGYLLGLWGLPYAVVEAVALHHGPTRVPQRSFDAVAAVYLANLLARDVCGSPSYAQDDLAAAQEYLQSLGEPGEISEWRAMAAEGAQLLAEVC